LGYSIRTGDGTILDAAIQGIRYFRPPGRPAIFSMKHPISKTTLLNTLALGVKATTEHMGRVTEFRGGPVRTEYFIVVDLARAFIRAGYVVAVECLHRHFLNALVSAKPASQRRVRKRADLAVLAAELIPLAIVEAKIRIKKLTGVHNDLDKVTHSLRLLTPKYARNVWGVVVFQVHIAHTRRRFTVEHFKREILKTEAKLEQDLIVYADKRPGFRYELHPLQDPGAGVVPPEIDYEGDEQVVSSNGHATRYYAILFQRTA
jgi:hypothetical protein